MKNQLNNMEIYFEELATDQFYELKEKTLDEDRHVLGANSEQDYDINGVKFKIKVNGFWEKSTWFNWTVFDENGVEIKSGTEC
jgi:hypothetical protein